MGFDIDVRCGCGKELDAGIVNDRKMGIYIEIEQCSYCIDEAKEEGRKKGVEEADNAD